MKFAAKLSATALAGLMALSMTACGAASNNATTPGYNNRGYTSGTYANGNYANGTYRYNTGADNKGNVRQNVSDLMNDTGRAANNIGNDLAPSFTAISASSPTNSLLTPSA